MSPIPSLHSNLTDWPILIGKPGRCLILHIVSVSNTRLLAWCDTVKMEVAASSSTVLGLMEIIVIELMEVSVLRPKHALDTHWNGAARLCTDPFLRPSN